MPRDGAINFSDLIGKLDVLYVHCAKCNRAGRYQVQHLIKDRGRDARLIDWLDEITADCPKKSPHNMNDQCGARASLQRSEHTGRYRDLSHSFQLRRS